MKAAYVRLGNRSHIAEVCSLGEPFPEEFFAFGERVEVFLRVKMNPKSTDTTRLAVACDWLRDRDWIVLPEGNVTTEGVGYYTARSLKERGWTPKMIERHLAEPDKELDNPHYRTAAAMRLYARTRVHLLETFPDIAEQLLKVLSRRSIRPRLTTE